jgi:uncharacterized membrane protein YhiD involved in acid resistance
VATVTHEDLVLFGRVGLAFLLCYAVGFERALRGAAAGDRTFSLVGTAAAAMTAVTAIRRTPHRRIPRHRRCRATKSIAWDAPASTPR